MICVEEVKRLHPDTAHGHMLQVIHTISSMKKEEIDSLQKVFVSQCGHGRVVELDIDLMKEGDQNEMP